MTRSAVNFGERLHKLESGRIITLYVFFQAILPWYEGGGRPLRENSRKRWLHADWDAKHAV